mmetsp:Transcript_16709/g.45661  ORF Transcript_16709/g.45661 Transcript_16709/m.45661 type:complete len:179 (+) Transcript_16709:399-935(+)
MVRPRPKAPRAAGDFPAEALSAALPIAISSPPAAWLPPARFSLAGNDFERRIAVATAILDPLACPSTAFADDPDADARAMRVMLARRDSTLAPAEAVGRRATEVDGVVLTRAEVETPGLPINGARGGQVEDDDAIAVNRGCGCGVSSMRTLVTTEGGETTDDASRPDASWRAPISPSG